MKQPDFTPAVPLNIQKQFNLTEIPVMEATLAIPGAPSAAVAPQAHAIDSGPKLAEESFSQKVREIAKRELNAIGFIMGICELAPLKKK